MKKFFSLSTISFVLIVSFLLFVTGCADSGSGSDGDKVTITVMSRWEEFNDLLVDELIPKFEEEHPDIKVENQTNVNTDYVQALQAAVNGGDLPDIFASHTSLPTHELQDMGVLHKVDDVIEESNYDKDDFENGIWTPGSTTVDDDIYAVPLFSNKKDTMLMFYNKEILDEAGLTEDDVPETWEELIDVSNEIMEKTDAYGTYLDINNWTIGDVTNTMASAITPEVANGINYKTGEYDYNTEGNRETLEFIKTLVDEGIDEPSDKTRGEAEGAGVFASGKVAFLLQGKWATSQFEENDFEEYGVAPLPTKDGKEMYAATSGADLMGGFHVAENTEHYEEVKEFLLFLIDEGYETMVEEYGGYPPVPEVIENADVPDSPKADAYELDYESFIRTPDPVLNNTDATKVKVKLSGKGTDKTLEDVAQGVISGQIDDIEATLQEMTDEQNEAFEEAIKKVQDDGVDIDQSAWKFPDWEPLKPYEE